MGVPSVIDCDIVLPPPALYTLPRGVAVNGQGGVASGSREKKAAVEGGNHPGGRTRKDSKKAAKLSTLKKRKGSKSQTESVV